MIERKLDNCLALETNSIKECILYLEKSTKQIIFVVDKNKKLLGSLTDGDLRRAILKNYDLGAKIKSIYKKKPIKCFKNISSNEALKIMQSNKINHLPIVDPKNKIIAFYSRNYFQTDKKEIECDFVIMAGGKGTRLKPYTNNRPKPMLKISGKPILEIIINNAKKQGFENFIFSINYLGKVIENYFKNGKKFGVEIKYIKEKKPLGTIGSLANFNKEFKNKNIVVSNGDVISDINYKSLVEFHKSNKSDATMAVYPYKLQNPYGEVVTNEAKIIDINEKPISISYVNAGVYVFKKNVLKLLKKNKEMDAVTFFNTLRLKKKKTMAFAVHENWKDIGIKNDFLNFKI